MVVICAGEIESFDFAKPMGIGLIDTAINLTKFCIKNRPKSILFIGSAGSYGEYNIFDIVKSNTASNIENSFFNANSYTPINTIISSNKRVSCETIINSSNYITTDFNISKHYISKNIGLENMEFFSILKVAERFNIEASGVFIVTNYCNENAHKDFIKNHREAMRRLESYFISSISSSLSKI
jgi:nucleoside phosphorylase